MPRELLGKLGFIFHEIRYKISNLDFMFLFSVCVASFERNGRGRVGKHLLHLQKCLLYTNWALFVRIEASILALGG